MPRFVLVRHEVPPDFPRDSHWDLMLESGSVLLTWALSRLPWDSSEMDAVERGELHALRLDDHRTDYLNYEGPVSGNRGTVTQVDAGTYEAIPAPHDRLRFRLRGRQIRGELTLERMPDDDRHWRMDWSAEVPS